MEKTQYLYRSEETTDWRFDNYKTITPYLGLNSDEKDTYDAEMKLKMSKAPQITKSFNGNTFDLKIMFFRVKDIFILFI